MMMMITIIIIIIYNKYKVNSSQHLQREIAFYLLEKRTNSCLKSRMQQKRKREIYFYLIQMQAN